MVKRAATVLVALLLAIPAYGQSAMESGYLKAEPGPGSENRAEPRVVVECNGRVDVYNTSRPRYDIYLPDPARASGAAVVMLPGGGLRVLGMGEAMDAEIAALVGQGVAVMRVEYRTRQLPADGIARECAPPDPDAPPIRFPKMKIVNGNANPAPNDAQGQLVLKLATDDAKAAIAMLHARADELGLDRDRIGVLGTSAGGGVAFAAMLDDTAPASEKPDFLISIFGPALQDVHVPDPAPPLFLVTEADHGPVTDGLLAVFSIWKDADEKVELHVYDVPNFSMRVGLWGPRLFDWLEERGILPAREESDAP